MKARLSPPIIAVAALAIAAWLVESPGRQPEPKKAAANHRVVRVSGPDARSPVEVSVAIDPTNPDHIVAVSQQRGTKAVPGGNHAYVSTDAGRSWKTAILANPLKRIQGDDAVTFAADGLALRTYISFLGIRTERPDRAANGIWFANSRDGLAWSDPVAVIDHVNTVHPYEDKPWIKADNNKDSAYKGNIYIAWTQFDEYGSNKPEHKTHVYASRSKNQGKSFSVPHRISETPGDCLDSSKTVMGAMPAVGPKGEVYVVWGGPKGLAFVKSTDGGWTFGKEKVVTDTAGGWDFNVKGIFRCNGLPSIGVDCSDGKHRGAIHVNWADLRNGDPDIFISTSTDGGETWTKPLRVNDDPVKNGKEQFFTWMAVDPVDGSVNIVFFDRRDSEGTLTTLTLARSVDGGKTFVNHKIDQPPFECDKKAFFGDYIGIDAVAGRVVAAYQHFTPKMSIALSAAIFDFRPGTQEPKAQKAAEK